MGLSSWNKSHEHYKDMFYAVIIVFGVINYNLGKHRCGSKLGFLYVFFSHKYIAHSLHQNGTINNVL